MVFSPFTAGSKVSVNGCREQEASISGKQDASVSGRRKAALARSEASVSGSVNGQPVVLLGTMQILHCDMLVLCDIPVHCCFTVASFLSGSLSFLTCSCFQVRVWMAAVHFHGVFVFVPLVAY